MCLEKHKELALESGTEEVLLLLYCYPCYCYNIRQRTSCIFWVMGAKLEISLCLKNLSFLIFHLHLYLSFLSLFVADDGTNHLLLSLDFTMHMLSSQGQNMFLSCIWVFAEFFHSVISRKKISFIAAARSIVVIPPFHCLSKCSSDVIWAIGGAQVNGEHAIETDVAAGCRWMTSFLVEWLLVKAHVMEG